MIDQSLEMRKPVLTIFYQFDPWDSSIGGIQTIIRTFIKYAPDEFDVRLVGITQQPSLLGKWQERELAGKRIQFMPIAAIENDDVRHLIPTSVKYTAALFGQDFSSDFMHFHRIEPTLATRSWSGEKTLFIHNDIQQQLSLKSGKQSLLWQYAPGVYFALEKRLIGQFDVIYSCNTNSTNFYRQRYPQFAGRVINLNNTVDPEIFYPLNPPEKARQRQAFAQQLSLPENTQFVLFAGRLHPQKDPLLLVQSIAALDDPNVHLLIAGAGELTEDVRQEINRLNLSERVTMLGPVKPEKLAELHRVSSICILTSVYEGLPVVVLEALSSGTPVVTTDCGETPNLLSANSGRVCAERTPQEIAANIRSILQHPENYPASACVKTARPYSAPTVTGQVYQQMLQSWEKRN